MRLCNSAIACQKSSFCWGWGRIKCRFNEKRLRWSNNSLNPSYLQILQVEWWFHLMLAWQHAISDVLAKQNFRDYYKGSIDFNGISRGISAKRTFELQKHSDNFKPLSNCITFLAFTPFWPSLVLLDSMIHELYPSPIQHWVHSIELPLTPPVRIFFLFYHNYPAQHNNLKKKIYRSSCPKPADTNTNCFDASLEYFLYWKRLFESIHHKFLIVNSLDSLHQQLFVLLCLYLSDNFWIHQHRRILQIGWHLKFFGSAI